MYGHTHAHDDDFLFEQQRDPSDSRFHPVEYAASPPQPPPQPSPQPPPSPPVSSQRPAHTVRKDDSLSQALSHATLQPIAVDIRRAAQMLCTSPWQIRQLIYSGQLKPFKLGKKYLIRFSDIQAFVDEQASGATGVKKRGRRV